MATQNPPTYRRKILSDLYKRVTQALQKMRAPNGSLSTKTTPIPTSSQPTTVQAVQWPLDQDASKGQAMNKVVIVEVENLPHETHVADLRRARGNSVSSNYSKDGEDQNQKITNYPPSDRLH